MNNQLDELTKGLARSVTRRAALRKFGVGLAGLALACFGLARNAKAASPCGCNRCQTTLPTNHPAFTFCRHVCGMPCKKF